MHTSILSSPILLLAASLPTILAAAPVITWDCSKIPNVCENMCWGVACNNNQGAFSSLTYDAPDKETKKDRRSDAFCGSHNRCGKERFSEEGYSCDEFPFSSTAEADLGGQLSRCVPGYENEGPRKPYALPPGTGFNGCDAQGKILSKFGAELRRHYSSTCKGSSSPCKYTIAFENFDTTNSYCALKSGDSCDNTNKAMGTNLRTGNAVVSQKEMANGMAVKDTTADVNIPTKRMTASSRNYKLESGRTITTFQHLNVGDDTMKIEPTGNCSSIENSRQIMGIEIDPDHDPLLDVMFHVSHDKVVGVAE